MNPEVHEPSYTFCLVCKYSIGFSPTVNNPKLKCNLQSILEWTQEGKRMKMLLECEDKIYRIARGSSPRRRRRSSGGFLRK